MNVVSTKIFHGYRLHLDGRNTLDALEDLRDRLEPVYRALVVRWCTRHAAFSVDRTRRVDTDAEQHDTTGDEQRISPLVDAELALWSAHTDIRRTGRRNPDADFSFEVAVLPERDTADRPTTTDIVYVLLYTEQQALTSVWETFPGVEAWPWFDNTDRPDDIDETVWRERGDTWSRVLGTTGVPSRRGMTWSLLGEQHHAGVAVAAHNTTDDEIAAHIPDIDERALTIARRCVRFDVASVRDIVTRRDELVAVTRTLADEIAPTLTPITVADLQSTTVTWPNIPGRKSQPAVQDRHR